MSRLEASTPELDRAELDWWEENGELEERYCWVQTPRVQHFLRAGYLRRMIGELDRTQSVLELGCGTGWLTSQLARAGAAQVVGVDGSPSQIERARASVAELGLGNRVRLEVGDTSSIARDTRRFDLVVMHAFLHHLSIAEIREVLGAAAGILTPGGRLAVVEPIYYIDGAGEEPVVLRALRRLQRLPIALHGRGLRRLADAERDVRDRLANRSSGDPPFGPAPKELPFRPEELIALLDERFAITRRSRELAMAHLVAQELLVAQLSQPRLWRALLPPLLWIARALDRRLLRVEPPPRGVWVMEFFDCTVRDVLS